QAALRFVPCGFVAPGPRDGDGAASTYVQPGRTKRPRAALLVAPVRIGDDNRAPGPGRVGRHLHGPNGVSGTFDPTGLPQLGLVAPGRTGRGHRLEEGLSSGSEGRP